MTMGSASHKVIEPKTKGVKKRHAMMHGNKEERRQRDNTKSILTDYDSRRTISIHPDVQETRSPGTQEALIQGYTPSRGK
jgi:hypothetical protein